MDQAGRETLAFDGNIESIQDDLRMQGLAHGPADDLAGVHVEDGGEMEPAFARRNVGQVGQPDLVRSRRLEVPDRRVRRGESAARRGIDRSDDYHDAAWRGRAASRGSHRSAWTKADVLGKFVIGDKPLAIRPTPPGVVSTGR